MNFLNIKDVCRATTLSRATVYRGIAEGRFPKPLKLSPRRVAWPETAIEEWAESRLPKNGEGE